MSPWRDASRGDFSSAITGCRARLGKRRENDASAARSQR